MATEKWEQRMKTSPSQQVACLYDDTAQQYCEMMAVQSDSAAAVLSFFAIHHLDP